VTTGFFPNCVSVFSRKVEASLPGPCPGGPTCYWQKQARARTGFSMYVLGRVVTIMRWTHTHRGGGCGGGAWQRGTVQITARTRRLSRTRGPAAPRRWLGLKRRDSFSSLARRVPVKLRRFLPTDRNVVIDTAERAESSARAKRGAPRRSAGGRAVSQASSVSDAFPNERPTTPSLRQRPNEPANLWGLLGQRTYTKAPRWCAAPHPPSNHHRGAAPWRGCARRADPPWRCRRGLRSSARSVCMWSQAHPLPPPPVRRSRCWLARALLAAGGVGAAAPHTGAMTDERARARVGPTRPLLYSCAVRHALFRWVGERLQGPCRTG